MKNFILILPLVCMIACSDKDEDTGDTASEAADTSEDTSSQGDE